MTRKSRQRLLDSLFVAALILYLVAGLRLVPFHGDESTIIFMSRDWHTLVIARDFASVFYRDPPPDPEAAAAQELRLLNGVTAPYTIGLIWWLAGIPAEAVNKQWLWGADWAFNRDHGHMPGDPLLFAARLSATLLTALSVALIFAAGRRLGGRGSAWLAALVYATMPAVLLNGRRAMFEGAALFTLALLILAGLETARHIGQRSGAWRCWLGLGLATGLAFASKHSALILAAPVFGLLILRGWRLLGQTLIRALLAGSLAGIVFLALNPAWWSAPLRVPGEVLRLRSELLSGQAEFFGGYADDLTRVAALFEQPLGPPQYYEDPHGWPTWLADQIAAYEASGLVGFAWGQLGILLVPVMLGSLWAAFTARRRAAQVWLLWSVMGGALVVLWFLNPVPWQRYYLPLAVPFALILGLGAWQGGLLILRAAGPRIRSHHA